MMVTASMSSCSSPEASTSLPHLSTWRSVVDTAVEVEVERQSFSAAEGILKRGDVHHSGGNNATLTSAPPAAQTTTAGRFRTRTRQRRLTPSAPSLSQTHQHHHHHQSHHNSPSNPQSYTPSLGPQTSSSQSQVQSPDLQPSASSHSYFALRPNPSVPEPRSPFSVRRPPASRSSHGIETASGPPPALSTQRSFSIDSWRFIAAESSPLSPEQGFSDFHGPDVAKDKNGVDALSHNILPDDEFFDEIHDPDVEPSIDFQDEQVTMTTAISQHRSTLTGESTKNPSISKSNTIPARPNSNSSNEDLFFDLANGEDSADATVERRPSRKGSHRHAQSQPNAHLPASQLIKEEEMRSSPIIRDRRGSLRQVELGSMRTPTSAERATAIREKNYAASAHPLDSRPLEQRYRTRLSSANPKPVLSATRGLSTRERSPESPTYVPRRQSVTDAQSYRLRNNLQYGANGTYHSSPLTGRQDQYPPEPSPPAREGTESSVSTTAPSTVWDELDDLKSRIRKLELTGKIPSSSGSAMASSGDRPRTATTTVTTMSSSPKRQTYGTSPTFNLESDADSIHPLLRSALAKAQTLVGPEVYRCLEASAADALALAKLSANNTPGSVTHGAVERQLKRKTDSLCRSITELCIALSDGRISNDETAQEKSNNRPVSRDTSRSRPRSIILDEPRYQRAASIDAEPASARVFSRLEARRLSLMSGSTAHPSPTQNGSSTPNASTPNSMYPNPDYQVDSRTDRETTPAREREPPTPTQATLSRTSTVLSRIRGDGTNDSETTIRPLSRARTELGRRSIGTPGHEKRKSREYTSNFPLPSEGWTNSSPNNAAVARDSPREPTAQAASGLPVRRSFLPYSNGASPASRLDGQQTLQKELPGLPGQTQPGTPTTAFGVGIAESTPGRITRRNYLDRSTDSTRATVDGHASQSQTQGDNRTKRLSAIGLGSRRGLAP